MNYCVKTYCRPRKNKVESMYYDFSRVAPDLTFSNPAGAGPGRIWELKSGRSQSRGRIWLKLVFWSPNNTPVIILMASTMLSAAIEAVHFSASFVALLFASLPYKGDMFVCLYAGDGRPNGWADQDQTLHGNSC